MDSATARGMTLGVEAPIGRHMEAIGLRYGAGGG